MLVSVVMPARNAATTIGEQLAALARQEGAPPWELLVVDDGSTDGTAAIAAATPRARTIQSARAGPSAARNTGAGAGRGEVLAFCDADDVVAPGWLASIVAAVQAGHEVVAGAIDLRSLDAGAPRWQDWALNRPHTWRGRPFAVSANMALRRAAFEAVGGFDETITCGEDLDVSLRLARAGYPIYFERQAVVAKRPARSLAGVWYQAHRWGQADRLLAGRYPVLPGPPLETTVPVGAEERRRSAPPWGRPRGYLRLGTAAAGRLTGRTCARRFEAPQPGGPGPAPGGRSGPPRAEGDRGAVPATQHPRPAVPTTGTGGAGSFDVSVIIPAYRAGTTLRDCVERVLAQDTDLTVEVLVCVSADGVAEWPCLPAEPRVRVLSSPSRLSAAEARNRGAAVASGQILVFTDADTWADREWLSRLVGAARSGAIVAGSVGNGTPESRAGTVEYLVEFLDLHPARPSASTWHGATCNLAVPRPLWAIYGPFPESFGGCEDTWLTARAARDGRLCFVGDARTWHRNRTSWRAVLANQHRIGRWTARIAPVTPYKFAVLVRSPGWAPAAAAGRVLSLYARAWKWDRRQMPRYLALAPGVVAAEAAWGWGLAREHLRLARRRTRGVEDAHRYQDRYFTEPATLPQA